MNKIEKDVNGTVNQMRIIKTKELREEIQTLGGLGFNVTVSCVKCNPENNGRLKDMY